MEFTSDFETYIKLFIGIIGAIATFGKIRESFSSIKRKQEVKIDFEIYEKMRSNPELNNEDIKLKVQRNLIKAYEDKGSNLISFLIGIVIFVGFAFWSIDIYNNMTTFNGWIILTMACSITGFVLIFSKSDKTHSPKLFYQIGFYDKENFRASLITAILSAAVTVILILVFNGFSYWQFLSGLFFFISIITLFYKIKRIK